MRIEIVVMVLPYLMLLRYENNW